MSHEPDELTQAQLEELKADLKALQRDLQHSIEQTQEGARPVDLDEPIGRLSRMEAMQQQKMVEANRRASTQRLQSVRQALHALDGDLYGECKLCDDPIGYRRLKARPEVVICIRCQSEREGGA